MGLLAALLVCAAEPGLGAPPPAAAAPLRWGVALALGPDVTGFSLVDFRTFSVWSELELSFRALKWLRVAAVLGGAYPPPSLPGFPAQHGVVRALGAAEVLWPLRAADLFLGGAAGVRHTNLFQDSDSVARWGQADWVTGLALMVRAGAELHLSTRLSVGGLLAYEYFSLAFEPSHSVELRVRLMVSF